MPSKYAWVDAPARFLIASLFLVSATTKVTEPATLQSYMHAYRVPEILVWPAAAWEYFAGVLLVIGFWVRPISILLVVWCVLTAMIFHTDFTNLDQLMNFFKNMTMAGSFLLLARSGSWGGRIDSVLGLRRPASP